jgi:hypothetical protein
LLIENPRVGGSIPSLATIPLRGPRVIVGLFFCLGNASTHQLLAQSVQSQPARASRRSKEPTITVSSLLHVQAQFCHYAKISTASEEILDLIDVHSVADLFAVGITHTGVKRYASHIGAQSSREQIDSGSIEGAFPPALRPSTFEKCRRPPDFE